MARLPTPPLMLHLLAALHFLLLSYFVAASAVQPQVELSCNPCIDRPTYSVRAIVHGTASDGFWQQVRAAAVQAGRDMRIDLNFGLYDAFDTDRMAADIVAAATDPLSHLDALIVTIPSPAVEAAIAIALQHVPVFGMNSGYEVAERLGVLGFIAMEEERAGSEAAGEFMSRKNVTRALFVNHEKGNSALDARFRGFSETLRAGQFKSDEVQVDEMAVDLHSQDSEATIASAFEGCAYDAILVTGDASLEAVTQALYSNGCPLSENLLAAFDTNSRIYDAIAVGKVAFAISQQQHLQGALAVAFAAVYATTGKRIARSAESSYGIYFSGPSIISLQNLPSDTMQTCEADAFPVCPNTKAPDGVSESRCPCTDRSKIKIGGVLHGVTNSGFWDVVFGQAAQAADDLGIDLMLDRLEPQDSKDVLHAKMANKMISLCQEGVDGLFVTIPSDTVLVAIQTCQALNVPVMSINSGAQAALELGLLHHASQLEYSAGYSAGQRMVESGMVEGVCLRNEADNSGLTERCLGFEEAITEASGNGVTYLGILDVPKDSQASYIKTVQDAIDRPDDDWEGIGFLATSRSNTEPLLVLKADHSAMLIGAFDTSDAIYDAVEQGLILFGIDQNPFMQGYMPVWLLTLVAYTRQHLANTFIETGPNFVETAPTEALQICEANDFAVCPRPINHDKNQIDRIRPIGLALAAVILAGSIFFSAWVGWYRNASVVKKSQPLFLCMICAGTFLMGSAIIPLSIDDSIASTEGCTKACRAIPWLFSLGFTTSFSALFSKIWRLNKVMHNARSFRRIKLSARDVMAPFAVLLTMNVALMVVWTVVDPMYWERTITYEGPDGIVSFGVCMMGHTGVSVAMLSCLLVLGFIVIVLANIEAYRARRLSTEFSESKYVAMVMVGFFQTMVVGIPLIALVRTNPSAGYFVKSAIIFVLCISILLLIFVPKMHYFWRDKRRREDRRNVLQSFSQGTNRGLNVRLYSISQPVYQKMGITEKHIRDLEKLAKMELKPLFREVGVPIIADGTYNIERIEGGDEDEANKTSEESTKNEREEGELQGG